MPQSFPPAQGAVEVSGRPLLRSQRRFHLSTRTVLIYFHCLSRPAAVPQPASLISSSSARSLASVPGTSNEAAPASPGATNTSTSTKDTATPADAASTTPGAPTKGTTAASDNTAADGSPQKKAAEVPPQQTIDSAPPPTAHAGPGLPPSAWKPRPGKYLLAPCLFGRITNQVWCMRATLGFAQLLNRSLLVPSMGVAVMDHGPVAYIFPWDVVVDWRRMRTCFEPRHGPNTVLTTAEYRKLHKRTKVDVTFSRGLTRNGGWVYPTGNGGEEFMRQNRDLVLPPRPDEDTPILSPDKATRAELLRTVGALEDDIINLGDLFNVGVDPGPDPPEVITEECRTIWMPHPDVMECVRGIVSTHLGQNFAAVHLRRGDFYAYMSGNGRVKGKKLEGTYSPIAKAAEAMRKDLLEKNMSVLYVATDARKIELQVYRNIIQGHATGSTVISVFSLRDLLTHGGLQQKSWAKKALELEKLPNMNGLVYVLIDKYVCAASTTFYGQDGSTFSMDIYAFLKMKMAAAKLVIETP